MHFELKQSRPASLPATNNHQGGLGDPKTLGSNQLHSFSLKCQCSYRKGTLKELLLRKMLDHHPSHIPIKVFRGVFTTAKCEGTIITLLDPNLNAFQPFWPGLYLLNMVDVPCILRDCTFLSADLLASLSNVSFK